MTESQQWTVQLEFVVRQIIDRVARYCGFHGVRIIRCRPNQYASLLRRADTATQRPYRDVHHGATRTDQQRYP
ncbi:MAG: hypothetical protein GXP15_13625 [Gammaproteobacteria bacterium]|nr:hypothetical protein [Gammaproteobacteria bacterium]